MTYHMMWDHRLRLGKKGLDGWHQGACQQHVYLMVYTWCTHGWYMDYI